MLIIGVTGSIAMGKSTIVSMLQKIGIPIISADKIVHDLYEAEAVPLIENIFPGCTNNNKVDRAELLKRLVQKQDGFKVLEEIIHPLVRKKEWEFIKENKEKGSKIIAIEIPLLFETGADNFMDAVFLATAPSDVQKQRVLARPEMTEEKFETLLAKQMPDAEKRKKTKYILNTDCSKDKTEQELKEYIHALNTLSPYAYNKWSDMMEKSE